MRRQEAETAGPSTALRSGRDDKFVAGRPDEFVAGRPDAAPAAATVTAS